MGVQVRRFANSHELSLTVAWFAETDYASDAARRAIMIAGLTGQRVGLQAPRGLWSLHPLRALQRVAHHLAMPMSRRCHRGTAQGAGWELRAPESVQSILKAIGPLRIEIVANYGAGSRRA